MKHSGTLIRCHPLVAAPHVGSSGIAGHDHGDVPRCRSCNSQSVPGGPWLASESRALLAVAGNGSLLSSIYIYTHMYVCMYTDVYVYR